MKNEANKARDIVLDASERLTRDVDGIVSEASELLKSCGERNLESAKATLGRARAALTDSTRQYAHVTEAYLRANPWKAAGIAAAAGALAAILFARRR